ncbi:radical SAM protein [Clostridium bowmanii]|uniref:radical SAM/SPASM domain-containing protein n=1 Tax=Clostridium bowmanii TaxID=132925 RepID=UPI001C0D918E|nr:radical SAM/SPASM domain-containing protein [Clostridium bowmanii]MBU3190605.1 radical SAM protein [Clostridium bowmanii]MCA1075138.1 radical SAM protein [Clostridium bowmanii]
MKRINPFKSVYDICDNGDIEYKANNVPVFARYIDIEVTNNCNYKCLMCPVGTGSINRKQGFMNEYVYDKILNEIKEYKTPLRFIRWGEPTLHMNFIEYIKIAKDLGIICHFNTNGSLFSKKQFNEIVDIELDSIKFSFQGVDKKSYSEMRNTDYFSELLDKIKMLYDIRGDKAYPYIHVSTTITYETEEQVKKFKKEVEKYADLVTVGRTILDYIDLNRVKLEEKDKNMIIRLKGEESVIKQHPKCCPEVFDKLSINWDGSVSACCGDYDNKMIIGNIKDNTLLEIWNSNKMNSYRKILSEKRYDELELCKVCYDYMELQASGLQNV